MNEESILQASTTKGILNYETVINMHIMRSNQSFQSITSQKGIGIPILMSMYATINSLDGMIRNERQTKEYDATMDDFIKSIKADFTLLGDANTDDIKFVNAWLRIMDAYRFQLMQMNSLGLTPAEDVDDILPTIVEKVGKVIEVPPWYPEEGAFDYKKDLGLSLTDREKELNTGEARKREEDFQKMKRDERKEKERIEKGIELTPEEMKKREFQKVIDEEKRLMRERDAEKNATTISS